VVMQAPRGYGVVKNHGSAMTGIGGEFSERLRRRFKVRVEDGSGLELLHEHRLHDHPQRHELVLHGQSARVLGELLAVQGPADGQTLLLCSVRVSL